MRNISLLRLVSNAWRQEVRNCRFILEPGGFARRYVFECESTHLKHEVSINWQVYLQANSGSPVIGCASISCTDRLGVNSVKLAYQQVLEIHRWMRNQRPADVWLRSEEEP